MKKRYVLWLARRVTVSLTAGLGALCVHKAQATSRCSSSGSAGAVRGLYAVKHGFYAKQGLNVTLKNGGPDIIPEQVVASGQAQFGVDWLPSSGRP
jgi:NitT/TauT family transport system substrate-binding protein